MIDRIGSDDKPHLGILDLFLKLNKGVTLDGIKHPKESFFLNDF